MKARSLLTFFLLLSLTACSGVKFAYNSLERLTLFKLDDYLELTSSDKKDLRNRLSSWKNQSLLATLPEIAQQLDSWEKAFQQDQLTYAEAQQLLENLDQSTRDLRKALAEEAFQFLEKQDPELKLKVIEKIHRRLEKKAKKISDPEELQEMVEERFERTMERFFDGAEPNQRELMNRLQAEAKEEYRTSLDCQKEWLDRFKSALTSSQKSELKDFLLSFFGDQREISSETCQVFLKNRWERWARSLSEVQGVLSADQKQYFSKRLTKWKQDLQDIVAKEASPQ